MFDDDYEEVEAIIRKPKDKKLATSSKDPDWFVGYTPKTSEKGPEHVQIKFKDAGEPSSNIANGDMDDLQPKNSAEQEAADDIAKFLVALAIVAALEAGKPFLQRLLHEKLIPLYSRAKNARAARRAKRVKSQPAVSSGSDSGSTVELIGLTMNSEEARAHLAQAIIAQNFANEKMRLLAAARVEGQDIDRKVLEGLQQMNSLEAEKALKSMLETRPTILSDLGSMRTAKALPAYGQILPPSMG